MERRKLIKSLLSFLGGSAIVSASASPLKNQSPQLEGQQKKPFELGTLFKRSPNGKIYIGKPDSNPKITDNQIQVYLENKDNTFTPVTQPIAVNADGLSVYNGKVSRFVTKQNYSMAIYDVNDKKQFYYSNMLTHDTQEINSTSEDFITDMKSTNGASIVNLQQGGSVQNAIMYLSPEMFGAVGNGKVDDSDAIIKAMAAARAKGINSVRGDGIYLIEKSIPCESGLQNLSKNITRHGFKLELNIVVVGNKYPSLPADWWDAEGAFHPAGGSSVENFHLHVREFYGNERATFFKAQGMGISTSTISCDFMRGHIIGFKNYKDPTFQSTMNVIRGNNWQDGYLGVLIGGSSHGQGNSECHNIHVSWCANHRFGGISLIDRSQYANVVGGTYDYNGKWAAVLTLDITSSNDAYAIEFGDTVSNGSISATALSSIMNYSGNIWQVIVTEPSDKTDSTSAFAVGDKISHKKFNAKIVAITLANTTTAVYSDIVICNRTGDFSKCRIAADYVGGVYGHNLFTSDIWGPSSTQNVSNMAYRGLAIAGTNSRMDLFATQLSETMPFASVQENQLDIYQDLAIANDGILKGTRVAEFSITRGKTVYLTTFNPGTAIMRKTWLVVFTSNLSGVSGIAIVTASQDSLEIANISTKFLEITSKGLDIYVVQTTNDIMNINFNSIRLC